MLCASLLRTLCFFELHNCRCRLDKWRLLLDDRKAEQRLRSDQGWFLDRLILASMVRLAEWLVIQFVLVAQEYFIPVSVPLIVSTAAIVDECLLFGTGHFLLQL